MTDWLAKIGVDENKLGKFEEAKILPAILVTKAILYLADAISKAIYDSTTKISGRMQ